MSGEANIKLLSLIREKINWENIRWALRSKIFFKKTFEETEDTFVKTAGLIDLNLIKAIFDIQFIGSEINRIFGSFPQVFKDIISKSFSSEGNLSLTTLEELIDERLLRQYYLSFYTGSGMLPIIAFFYLKRKEYKNIVELVESLKYNIGSG
jgi:vacuolar-type H+-ATPase subunit C/Vma6